MATDNEDNKTNDCAKFNLKGVWGKVTLFVGFVAGVAAFLKNIEEIKNFWDKYFSCPSHYTITFHNCPNGDSIIQYTNKDSIHFLPLPKKKDSIFAGWYDNNGNLITYVPKGSKGNKEFGAKYTCVVVPPTPCIPNPKIITLIEEARSAKKIGAGANPTALSKFEKAYELLCEKQKSKEFIKSIKSDDGIETKIDEYNKYFKSLNY